jgi:hypothetical protein
MGTTVNYANPKIDQTVKIFDQFYAYEANVPALKNMMLFTVILKVCLAQPRPLVTLQ